MANIKPIDQSSSKWNRRAAVATADYQAGVEAPRTPWSAAAAAADASYRAGVTAAASAGRFAAGVKAAGEERWKRAAATKGPSRFAEGVALAVDDWMRGFQPYQAAVSALSLPARGPKGSPQNIQRVSAVASALRQVRERISK